MDLVVSDSVNSFSWWILHWHADLYSGIFLTAGIYLIFIGPLKGRLVKSDGVYVSKCQIASFLIGLLVMLFALSGPIHELADNHLFGAHMAQHVLITLVVPPLLLFGTPDWLLRPVLRYRAFVKIGRVLTNPVVAIIVFNAVFAGWHFPVLYENAVKIHELHIVEHLFFIGASVIMWWPVMSPLPELPRLSYPGQVLYLFVVAISQTPLFATITFSNGVIYEFYKHTPRVWEITPLVDQQIGGIIMKVASLVIFVPALCIVFLRWSSREEGDGSTEFLSPH